MTGNGVVAVRDGGSGSGGFRVQCAGLRFSADPDRNHHGYDPQDEFRVARITATGVGSMEHPEPLIERAATVISTRSDVPPERAREHAINVRAVVAQGRSGVRCWLVARTGTDVSTGESAGAIGASRGIQGHPGARRWAGSGSA